MIDAIDGLEGIVAAETVLSEVDGEAGRLVIRGCSLDDLAGKVGFEDVVHLLFDGFFDGMPQDLTLALGLAREDVFAEVAALDPALSRHSPIETMRALTARLADGARRHPGASDSAAKRRPDRSGRGSDPAGRLRGSPPRRYGLNLANIRWRPTVN